MKSAIVLGMFDTGLDTARILRKSGFKVKGYDYNSDMAGFKSKYCVAKPCPNPITAPQELLNFLLSEIKDDAILYLCADEYVLFASRYRHVLEKKYKFLLPDAVLIETILEKGKQVELMNKIGIAIPKTERFDSIDKINETKAKFSYPLFIKPAQTFIWRKIFRNKGFKVNNDKQLIEIFEKARASNEKIIVQEIIPGPCSNNYEVSTYVEKNGDILGMFTIKKLRQLPLELGTATLTVSTKNKEAEETVLKIIKMLNWRGFANIEFKFDHRDGKYKLIEINPRIWQQIAHAQKLGINFIMAQYLDLCSKPQPCMVIYEEEIKWINPLDDFIAAIIMLIRGEISILFWIRSLKRIRSYGLFALDDLKPFLHAIKYGAIIFGLPRFLCNILRNKNREK